VFTTKATIEVPKKLEMVERSRVRSPNRKGPPRLAEGTTITEELEYWNTEVASRRRPAAAVLDTHMENWVVREAVTLEKSNV